MVKKGVSYCALKRLFYCCQNEARLKKSDISPLDGFWDTECTCINTFHSDGLPIHIDTISIEFVHFVIKGDWVQIFCKMMHFRPRRSFLS